MFINTQFVYLWLAQTLSQLATNILIFFIAFFIYQKTASNTAVSLALLSYLIPSFFASIIAGVLVARMGKKWVLLLSNVFRAAIVFLMFFLEKDFLYLYGLIFLLALVTQFFVPAESSIIPQIVPKNKLIAANAYFSTTINLTLILGFLISPILFKLFAYQTVFFIFVVYLLAAGFLYFLDVAEPLFFTNFEQPFHYLVKKFQFHLKFIFKNFISDKHINRNIFHIVIIQVILFILIAAAPGFADRILKIAVEDLSFLILLPAALGFLIASFILPSLKKVNERVLVKRSFFVLSFVFSAIFLISQFHQRYVFNIFNFLLLVGFGIFSGLVMVPAYANLQKKTSEEARAGYFGLLNAFINFASIIPVFASGIVSDIFGVDKIVLVLALVLIFLAGKS